MKQIVEVDLVLIFSDLHDKMKKSREKILDTDATITTLPREKIKVYNRK